MIEQMNDEQPKDDMTAEQPTERDAKSLPAGIARIHEEWRRQGLVPPASKRKPNVELEPVIFPEPVGDYRVTAEDARGRLGLSDDAMNRLLEGGELDSIQVRFDVGVRRMISESALARFIDDSGMDPLLADGLATPSAEVRETLNSILLQMQEMRETQARQLQQFKDMLLLELRNLKEQDMDLTSFVYDLTTGLEEVFPKLKKRRRTPPPGEGA
jgi:hypothetical protein